MPARAPRRLSPWRRLAALLLDYLVILAWMTLLAVVSLAVYLSVGDYPDVLGAVGPFGAQAVFFTLLTLPVGLCAVDIAILVYLGTSLLGRQLGPHDRASRTIVVESEAAGP